MAFIEVGDRQNLRLFSSFDISLPDNHLAKFVVLVVENLALDQLNEAYDVPDQEVYPPSLLLALLIYSYCLEKFSSRAIEEATYDKVPYYYICAGHHPDHLILTDFRRRFASEVTYFLGLVLEVAQSLGLRKLGAVNLAGPEIKVKTAKGRAFRRLRARTRQAHLAREVAKLLNMAEEADSNPSLESPQTFRFLENMAPVSRETIKKIIDQGLEREEENAAEAVGLAAREQKSGEPGPEPLAREVAKLLNMAEEADSALPLERPIELMFRENSSPVSTETMMKIIGLGPEREMEIEARAARLAARGQKSGEPGPETEA
ncbi:MAG: transposase [Deltaproteobacteria bacterium]|nr:transposase [Deltaproteobacteria bacterium]